MENKKGISITSINQTGGQTAHTIVNNYMPPKREISNEISNQLIAILKKYAGKRFKIYVSNNDLEGVNLATRIKSILIDSEWVETGFIYNLAGLYPSGIHIRIGGEPTEADQALADSILQLTDFKINPSKNQTVEDLSIVVGPNPE